MRLTKAQHHAIKQSFLEVFHEGEIYLFGSRVNDAKKGGDIDLYIRTKNLKNVIAKKLDFLVKLKREIGEQKIDVVFDRNNQRAIDTVAKETGVKL